MYCKECGTQIDDDSKFCVKCGTKQSSQLGQSESKVKINTTQIKDNLKKVIPPISKKHQKQKSPLDEKYDKSYKSDYNILFMAIFLWVIISAILINKDEGVGVVLIGLAFLFSVYAANWAWRIAHDMNRDTTAWSLFVLVLPVISLLILPFQKKILYTPNYSLKDDKKKSAENNYIAKRMGKAGFYEDSLIFSNKSIELNPENFEPFFTRGSIKCLLKDYEGGLLDMNKSLELNPKQSEVYYQRGLIHEKLGNKNKKLNDWQKASEMGHNLGNTKLEQSSDIESIFKFID